jgi:hypothetical protein
MRYSVAGETTIGIIGLTDQRGWQSVLDKSKGERRDNFGHT